MIAYETQYIFEAGGEGWAVIDFDDDEMTIKETRCNGQEDCHMMATLQRQADGTWKLEQPNMITEDAGERVAAAVEAFVTEHGPPQLVVKAEPKPDLRPGEIAERLTRLEALFVDPRDLAKLTDEELQEAARMPGGPPVHLGRLRYIEDRLVLLELAVTKAAASVGRAGITIDPLDGINWSLKAIATVLERAAGVQELAVAIAHDQLYEADSCLHCGCRLTAYGSGICPGCGQERVSKLSPVAVAPPTEEP